MFYDDPTVSIKFSGLLLFSINNQKQCEVEVLKCQDHNFVMDVQKVITNPRTGETGSFLEPVPLSLDKDIEIIVGNGSKKRVQLYTSESPAFDRKNDQGDPKDIRWAIDFEGGAFKENPVEIKRPGRGVKPLSPKIRITGGTLYSEMLSDEYFIVESLSDVGHQVKLGKVSFKIGLDIDDSEVILKNSGKDEKTKVLKKEPGVRYLITIDNNCPPARNANNTSDFLFFFDAVKNKQNEKFDLRRIVKRDDRGELGRRALDDASFSLDDHGQFCLMAFTNLKSALKSS